MPRKIAGKINQPPEQTDFNQVPLAALCKNLTGVFYRLHSTNRATGSAWPALHFSNRGNSRFDAKEGIGVLCVGETLAGAMMELFDDHWGAVGSFGRRVTEATLGQTWVTRISLPPVRLFDATGANLSKMGTDAQLLTGQYSTTRKWAARMMAHPDQIDGVWYRSRHDLNRFNVALFQRARFLPAIRDPSLRSFQPDAWARKAVHGAAVVHGDSRTLRHHPELIPALIELEVARLP